MKLSDQTLEVLQNFSTINNSLWFNKGKVLRTVSATKNIFAQAEVDNDFPIDFGIYDLDTFRSVLSLFDNEYELNFDDPKNLKIIGKSKISYRCTEQNMIVSPPNKTLDVSNPLETFEISSDDMGFMLKSAKALMAEYISIEGDGTDLNIRVHDKTEERENVLFLKKSPVTISMTFSVENFKFLSKAYHVALKERFIYLYTADEKLKYWVSPEKKA